MDFLHKQIMDIMTGMDLIITDLETLEKQERTFAEMIETYKTLHDKLTNLSNSTFEMSKTINLIVEEKLDTAIKN